MQHKLRVQGRTEHKIEILYIYNDSNLSQGSILIGGIIRAVMGENMFFQGFFE